MTDKDKRFMEFVRSRETDCPVCYKRLADHTDEEISACFQMHNIFKQANGKEPESA